MTDEGDRLRRLFEDIQHSQPDEIHCDRVLILLSRCAAAQLTDAESQRLYPQMWRHFRFCPDCAEEYQLVMGLARAEAVEIDPATIPPPPTEAETGFLGRVWETITAHFSAFDEAQALALTRGAEGTVEPVTIEFGDGALTLELDMAPHEADEALRELYCVVLMNDDADGAGLEGSPLWLAEAAGGGIILEGVLDELGEVTLGPLSPGNYILRLYLLEHEYRVTGIVIP